MEKTPPTFTQTINAKPGYTLADVAPATANMAGVKNLKVQLVADKRSATVSGEWTGESKAGKAAGSDVLVPLKLTEEPTTAVQSDSDVPALIGQYACTAEVPAARAAATVAGAATTEWFRK